MPAWPWSLTGIVELAHQEVFLSGSHLAPLGKAGMETISVSHLCPGNSLVPAKEGIVCRRLTSGLGKGLWKATCMRYPGLETQALGTPLPGWDSGPQVRASAPPPHVR